MKFPESWLREHVRVSATREQLAERLTAIGLEVEDMQVIGEALQGVLVAEILSCAKHPEADRLQVCQVAIGDGNTVQIVCGAPNVAAGQKVAVARVGTTLPDGRTLERAKLRGVVSNGMILSAENPDGTLSLVRPGDLLENGSEVK